MPPTNGERPMRAGEIKRLNPPRMVCFKPDMILVHAVPNFHSFRAKRIQQSPPSPDERINS
jgi:hypothetical protein